MTCLICNEEKQQYLYMLHGSALWQCSSCGLIFSVPQSSGMVDNLLENNEALLGTWTGKTNIDASMRYLEVLKKRDSKNICAILVAPRNHIFAKIASQYGVQITQHTSIKEFEQEKIEAPIDVIIILYQLEKSTNPQQILDKAYSALKEGGLILIVTPSIDSRSARFLGTSWTEWRPENKYYFDNTNIKSLLWKSGFNEVELKKDRRIYTLSHINERVTGFPKTWITKSVNLAYSVLPTSLHNIYFRLPTSGMILSARKTERRQRPILSVVVPVYNESATFTELMHQLSAKKINGVDKEIIIVESNSTDNSRELVMRHEGQPEIKIILQEKAKGKGNAVREGFQNAQGDILVIQDADLEYDLNDYEALLEPVLAFRKPFVLGSRHSGNWKMRHFNDQEQLAAYFNFGHMLFTALINMLYGQRLKDPFTMFKVFRRDCLHNLEFECNRFDFDFELVIKLIRNGYSPVEIPVNYNSRSFKEGKKVSMIRDPFTWLKASFKYRFGKITKD
jgi:hypothetical protein